MIILLCYKIIISKDSSTVATIAERFELNTVLCALHTIQPEGNPAALRVQLSLPGYREGFKSLPCSDSQSASLHRL